MGRTDITGERLLEYVTWDWQDVEQLRLRLIPTVAPGKALRTYLARTQNNKGIKVMSEDEQIASGARAIVNDRIGSFVGSGRLEYNDDRSKIRLAERKVVNKNGCCPTCYRPFEEATMPQQPKASSQVAPRPKVVYPTFPSWERHSQQQQGAI